MSAIIETMNGLEHVYTSHHKRGERLGFSIMETARGEFFSSRLGTGKKILDIGCRDGVLTQHFAKGNDVLGVDIDAVALEKARTKLGIQTKHVDLHAPWDLPLAAFDAVVAGEVIEHLYFPDVVLGNIAAVLKPDGMLVGSVPNAFSLRNRIRLFLGQKAGTPLSDPTHINHFHRTELKELLEKHFHEVNIVPAGRFAWLDRYVPGFFAFDLLFDARRPRV